jgi:hypothetical protein
MEDLQGEGREPGHLERTLRVSGFRNVRKRVHGGVHRLQYLARTPILRLAATSCDLRR